MRVTKRASPGRSAAAAGAAGTPAFPGVSAIDLWDLAAIVPPFHRPSNGGWM